MYQKVPLVFNNLSNHGWISTIYIAVNDSIDSERISCISTSSYAVTTTNGHFDLSFALTLKMALTFGLTRIQVSRIIQLFGRVSIAMTFSKCPLVTFCNK